MQPETKHQTLHDNHFMTVLSRLGVGGGREGARGGVGGGRGAIVATVVNMIKLFCRRMTAILSTTSEKKKRSNFY